MLTSRGEHFYFENQNRAATVRERPSRAIHKSMTKLQVIPLGGLGEFGMNMMALRYGDDILVIDSGMMFPEEELLGVDLVMPDLTYLRENAGLVRALLLTHGHEDHIGGVPLFLTEINVPVYGTAFTLALVERRLDEYDLEE